MIYADELIQSGQDYNMEIQFPGKNYLEVWWIRLLVITNCRDLGFGANFKLSKDDTWFLNYKLLDDNKIITHRELFDQAVLAVEPNAVWGNQIESGEKAGVITGSNLFKWIQDYWWVGMGFILAVMVIPIFYKRSK